MSQFRDKKLDMKQLINQFCKQIKGLSQQVLLTVWQAFRKLTFQQLELDRTIVILDCFYLQMAKINNSKTIKLMPTSTLLSQASLTYRSDDNDLSNIGSLISITQGNLYKQIESKDKENMEITKQNAYLIYTFVFKHIKGIIKKYKSVNIQLDFLGTISIYERTFIHQPDMKNINNQKIKVKQLIEKQGILQNCSDLKRHSILMKSKQSLLEKSKLNFMNTSNYSTFRPNDQSSNDSSDIFRNKTLPSNVHQTGPKKPLYQDIIDPDHPQNVRIINDLLGAGIDPLTYDYNHSKLVENGTELFNFKFQKPDKAKARFPALIDKFSRTIGSQLTGAKVSTSSSIRVGSNYTPSVKNYFIDLSKKQIMRVPQQITIKLEQKIQIYPATQQQEYKFIVSPNLDQKIGKQLKKKVVLRQKTFQRYREYYLKHIPNECVAPLSRQTLKRIVQAIKQLVKNLGKTNGKIIFDKLINQVNRCYYIAGKKSIVDYILKDQSQQMRTGIHIVFKPVHDWGIINQKKFICGVRRQNTLKKKKILENQFLNYPELILQIVKHSKMLQNISIFSQDLQKSIRPMNILYHLKKHSNHLGQIMTLLNEKWIKGAVEIITKNKNWKKQSVKNFKIFLNNVHTLMSNKLKQFIYRVLDFWQGLSGSFDYDNPLPYSKPILYLHLGEQNKKIIFMDDLNNIYRKQVNQIHKNIVKQLSQLISPECYIKEGEERHLWAIEQDDEKLLKYNDYCQKIVLRNFSEIQRIKIDMKKFQKVYKYKEELVCWTKNNFNMKDVDNKLIELKQIQKQIEQIPFFMKTMLAVIDCHDLKKKLFYEVKLMRYCLFETIQNLVKKNNQTIFDRINKLSDKISKEIKNTADYVELSKLIQLIKQQQLKQISCKISQNQSTLMKLFTIQNSFINQQLLRQIYNLNKSLTVLQTKVLLNEQRILKQRSQLQKTLRQRISNFQSTTVSQLREINLKIDSFQIRKLYQEYSIYLQDYKEKSQQNIKQMALLNHEEEDLKWAVTTFSSAVQLQNLITPNYQLWQFIKIFDQSVREWKHIELCNFDVQKCQAKVIQIDSGISKIINKLKNFSSLKIAHEIQNDVKEIITRQLSIIKIFSHPGLKQRHWHLFNKKLAIPGYDLKQITYGRIKMLYDYDKNLKVLTSISNQAAKQFQIENQKNQMNLYWYSLNCQIHNDGGDQYMIFLQDDFLNKQISVVEDHLMRTILIKNSPFSKALIQMLTDWQNYLISAKNILIAFKNAQQKFVCIKDIFKIDEISKYLPIENTQFQSIENIWKSVIRKVLEQPKISQLFKSQKILQILQQISKKSHYIKNSLHVYLHAKKVQFPRFFFVKDSDLINIFSLLNKGNEKIALKMIAQNCFNGLQTIERNDKGYKLKSSIDSMDIMIEKQSSIKRQKTRIIEECPMLLNLSRHKIKSEIQSLIGMKNLNENEINIGKYTLTSLLTTQHIKFTQRIMQIYGQKVKSQKQHNEQIEKQVKKYSRQLIESIKTKVKQINISQIRKGDYIIFRRLCYNDLLQNILLNKGSLQQYKYIPKLFFTDNQLNSLSLQIDDESLNYDFEYLGDSISAYQIYSPYNIRMMHHSLQNIRNQNTSLVQDKSQKICFKLLSQLSGKYYKQLQFIDFIQSSPNSINQILGGIVCADIWINLNMDQQSIIKNASQALSLISQIIQQKKYKINTKTDYLLIKDNQIQINKHTAIFLTISKSYSTQLPQRFFINCRSFDCYKNFSQKNIFEQILVCNELFLDWQTVSRLKIVIQLIRVLYPDIRINLNEVVINYNKILALIQQNQQQKRQGILVCKLLQKYLRDQQLQRIIRNFYKLESKQQQIQVKIKKQLISNQIIQQVQRVNQLNQVQQVNQVNQISQISQVNQVNQVNQLNQVNQVNQVNELNEIDCYIKQKIKILQLQTKFYNNIIIYGNFGFKTTLIHNYLTQFKLSSQNINSITINTNFIHLQHNSIHSQHYNNLNNLSLNKQNILSHHNQSHIPINASTNLSLNTILSKVNTNNYKSKSKYIQLINPIIFDGYLTQQHLTLINQQLQSFNHHHYGKSFTSFIECPNIQNINPQSIISFGKVYMNSTLISDKTIFQNWTLTLPLKPQQIQYLKSLIPPLQNIIDQIIKSKNIFHSDHKQVPKRFLLIKSFLKFFQVYLLNLNSKQVQALPQFDVQNYIFNSFIFTSYWALCIGYCTQQNRKIFQLYLKQTFGSQYDLPSSIEDNFLNQQNQWVNWQNLKQQFAPDKQSQSILCSLWVPTIQNTKFYTIIIKLIQKDIPILLFGSQSGKSTLIRQISNFQISYSTFIIDCNKLTDILKVNKIIKQKIIYGDEKKYLILVDDIHLSLKNQQIKINQLLLQIIKRSTLPNISIFGDLNNKIKKSNFIVSANQYINSDKPTINNSSFSRLINKFQPINLKRIDQKQLQAIFRPYINFSFVHNQFDNQILKLQNSIVNLIIKSIDYWRFYSIKTNKKQTLIDVNDMRKIVQSVCRLNSQQFKDKFEIFKFLIYQTYSLLSGKINLSQHSPNKKSTDHDLTHSLKKMLQLQHTKFCNPQKNTKQFENLLQSYIYRDLPTFQSSSIPNDLTQLKKMMQKHLKIKNQNPELILTTQVSNSAQKIIHFLKANPSHLILVSPKKSGSRSLIKIIAHLKNLTYIELGTTTSSEVFLQQIIKILKTGGKIDQCICCLPNEEIKQKQFIDMINSFICSSEFYQSFSQIQLEQIIKSFNSEKKILKKDIKKSEIIKKIKQKLNSIFHFVICVDRKKFNFIHETYPNMIRDSFVIVNDMWNQESIVEISSENLNLDKSEVKKVHKIFTQVYNALKIEQKQKQISQLILKRQGFEMCPISLMNIYKVFSVYMQKLQQTTTHSLNLWQKKINSNEMKLTQLRQQKLDFEKANKNHFLEIQELESLVEQKQNKLKQKKDDFKVIDNEYVGFRQNYMIKKTNFFILTQKFTQILHNAIDKQFENSNILTFKLSELIENGVLSKFIKLNPSLIPQKVDTIQCKQLIRSVQRIDKQGISLLKQQSITRQILQHQYQTSINKIQKSFISLLTKLYIQMIQISQQLNRYNNDEIQYKMRQQQYYRKQSQYRLIQDQIQQIKDEIQQQTDKNSKIIQLHQQMNNKIQHLQSVLSILKKLKNNINTENHNNHNIQQHITNNNQIHNSYNDDDILLNYQQKIALKILLSICIKQHITNPLSYQFQTIINTLTNLGYQLNHYSIFNALPIQQRIQFQYCLNDNTFKTILHYLTIQLSPIYCIVFDHQQQIQRKLKQWTKKQIIFFQKQNIQQLKGLFMMPGFIIIRNPSSSLINQLKPIFQHQPQISINKKPILTIDEFTFHSDAKIIFLYSQKIRIDQRIQHNSDWICEFGQNIQESHQIIHNNICKLSSQRNVPQIAQLYLQKLKQLQNLGERMHSLVVKIKKQNLSAQKMQQKLQQVNIRKISIQKQIKHYKSELKQIFNNKHQLNKYVSIMVSLLSNYNIKTVELINLLQNIFDKKSNDLSTSVQYLSLIVSSLFTKRKHESNSQKLINKHDNQQKLLHQDIHKINNHSINKNHDQNNKISLNLQLENSKLQCINYLITYFSTSNSILVTQEPHILKQCLLIFSQKYNYPFVQRKINQISSISFMSNVQILVQLKNNSDWESLITIMKSVQDKKLSITFIIICPQDIAIPVQIRNTKEFKLSSVENLLSKLLLAKQQKVIPTNNLSSSKKP